jgi:membrane associated rhomboid family serine protease
MSSDTLPEFRPDLEFFRKKLLLSIIIPGTVVFIMWLVKIVEQLFGFELSFLGIYPLKVEGLSGILLSPFLHYDYKHLLSNSIPVLVLGTGIFYFYSEVALKVTFWIYLLTGFSVWLAGRDAWHIGASGLVYGFASFLFFSGIIRKYFRLVALSLLVVFLYGSMVWGMIPDFYQNVSWESHMMGFVSGIIMAIWFRNKGPRQPVYEWMLEEEDEEIRGEADGAKERDNDEEDRSEK